jgi:hypothetical protein
LDCCRNGFARDKERPLWWMIWLMGIEARTDDHHDGRSLAGLLATFCNCLLLGQVAERLRYYLG